MLGLSHLKPLGRAGPGRRLIALAAAAMIIVPAALAWACNPQAYLKLDKATYGPGERVGVSGAFFKENTQLTLSLEPGGTVGTATTSANGSFTTSFAAPSSTGSYTLSAVGYNSDGTVINGLPARASFSVGTPAAPQPGGGSSQPGPAQPGAAQPQSRQGPRFAEPSTPRSEAFRGRRTEAGRAVQRGADVAAGGGVIRSAGGQVFAGSLPRGERTSAASGRGFAPLTGAKPAAKSGAKRARPGEQSAVGDVWGGFSSPSLLPRATDGAPDGGTGSQLAWGVGLLGLGLLALAVGVAGAEVRRRRATVR